MPFHSQRCRRAPVSSNPPNEGETSLAHALRPDLKYPDQAAFARAIGEDAMVMSSEHVYLFAPASRKAGAEVVFPYLVQAYDALYAILDTSQARKMFDRDQVEVAPLAYMRGRTLSRCFAILDEAQNTTGEQMKMFLTRLGEGSRAIITGDLTQVDLPRGTRSGLVEARRILENTDGIGVVDMSAEDIVRHRLVQNIVSAYEADERASESPLAPVHVDPSGAAG